VSPKPLALKIERTLYVAFGKSRSALTRQMSGRVQSDSHTDHRTSYLSVWDLQRAKFVKTASPWVYYLA
jgi:hypothetical protein